MYTPGLMNSVIPHVPAVAEHRLPGAADTGACSASRVVGLTSTGAGLYDGGVQKARPVSR